MQRRGCSVYGVGNIMESAALLACLAVLLYPLICFPVNSSEVEEENRGSDIDVRKTYASRPSQSRPPTPPSSSSPYKSMPALLATRPQQTGGGIKAYYQAKIETAELLINQKTQNLRRLEAQRNALNARGGFQL